MRLKGSFVVGLALLIAGVTGCSSGASQTGEAQPASASPATAFPTQLVDVNDFLRERNIPCEGARIDNLGVNGATFKVLECRVTPSASYPTMRFGLGDGQGQCKYAARAKEMALEGALGVSDVYNREIASQFVVGDGWWAMGENYDGSLPEQITPQALQDALGSAQVTTVGEFCNLKAL